MPGFNLGMGLGLGESRAPFARNPIARNPIAALFTTGVNGAGYDPSDFSTLFQDAAGTTPVTAVEQPVGLMKDKSKGLVLGPELVTNGDFSNGTTGWTAGGTASLSVVNGRLRILQTGTTAAWAYQSLSTVKGRRYWVSLNFESVSGSTLAVFVGTTIGGIETYVATPGNVTSYTFSFVATATSHYIGVQPWTISLNREAYFDNISVRELPGNHAFNNSGNSANFPVLSARYNLLTKTEQFDDVAWLVSNTLVTADTVNAPNGTLTADKIYETSATGVFLRYQSVMPGAGTYTMTVYAKSAERSKFALEYASSTPAAVFDLANGSVFSTTNCNAKITSAGSGWYICSMTATVAAGSTSVVSIRDASGNRTYTGDGISGIYIWGADLRVANDALNQPAYQRVNTATDYDTVGFKPYLSFNGVNQWLQTNSIDFTYGDKMFVCAGVRKLSDAGNGTLIELSSIADVNNSTFFLRAPSGGLSNYQWLSKGTALTTATPSSLVAPITNVLSGIGDISGDSAVLRVNGTQAEISTADQGTGNYGNYPLYIGARAGNSLWFNGRLYGLVVAGKAASANEIASTEAWLNQKTGAY